MAIRDRNKKVGEKPKDTKATIKRIFSYMKDSKLILGLVLICVLVGSLADIVGMFFIKSITDDFLIPLATNGYHPDLVKSLAQMLGLMAGVYVLGAVCTYLYSRLMLQVSTKTLYKIRVELFEKMEKLPIKYFDTNEYGNIMSTYTNDTDAIRQMLTESIVNVISSAVTLVGSFVMMLILSWQLTILVVIGLAAMVAVIGLLGKKSGKYFGKQQVAIGSVNGYVEEMIEGQKVAKVFCHEAEIKEAFAKRNEQLRKDGTQANILANAMMPAMSNMSNILYGIVAMSGGVLVVLKRLTLGTVVAFLQYTSSLMRPLGQLSQQMSAVLSAVAGAERIFKLMDEEPEVDDGYVTLVYAREDRNGTLVESETRTGIWAWKHPHKADGTITYTKVRGAIDFENVDFGYNEDKQVLNNISLYARPEQKIAFVGSTGAGKTTITNLINRFYDVPEGKIRFDGININKIKKADLRRSLSMVLQDTHLFTGTVAENIRYGKLDATKEEIIEAAKLANADSFIRHLPEGYDTVLKADGSNLSQGQRQLIAIARAAVADPPVLILDEATSSIDTRTEALIEKGMDRLMHGRTVLVIAHRLSTVRNSDAIMVLEDGEIIERGDHDDLIAQEGKYFQLYTGMFELS
jgi:ABC-type multidrug transport system, ATPase and permease components